MITDVTRTEEKSLKLGICPDCGSNKFLDGPCGGLCQNVKCANCGSEFNIGWPFTPQRISGKKTKHI